MKVVIIGSGHAGFQCAASLRQEGFTGEIDLLSGEPCLPYQRPPLSKAYLLGKASATDLLFRPADFYESHKIRLQHARVERIDPSRRFVVLQSQQTVPYDHLVLAPGAQPVRLQVPGSELEGVLNLQTIADANLLQARTQAARSAVVIGAGFIGLEFAAVARSLGLDVVVVDRAERPLARAASAECARIVSASHLGRGIDVRVSCGLEAILGSQGKVTGVQLSGGVIVPADMVVVGVGVMPRTELAFQAGLLVENGICVNEQLLTSNPDISAIGDAAAYSAEGNSRRIRLESVQNATDQARVVAARLVGKPVAYNPVPWFWSDQGDLKLQIAGLRAPDDEEVLLPDDGGRGYTILNIRGGLLSAVETINRPGDHMLARRLLAKRAAVTRSQALQAGFSLKARS